MAVTAKRTLAGGISGVTRAPTGIIGHLQATKRILAGITQIVDIFDEGYRRPGVVDRTFYRSCGQPDAKAAQNLTAVAKVEAVVFVVDRADLKY